MKIAKKVFNIIGTVLLILLLAVVIVIFNARFTGESPSVFGYHIFRVSSGSMEPKLLVGDVIVVKETNPEDIKKGDIITYYGKKDDLKDKYITHQVIENPVYETNGKYSFTTQGIAEGTIKDPTVYEDQVVGVYVSKLNFLDKVYSFFLTPYGLMSFILVIVILFGYELISLVVTYKTLDYPDEEPEDKKNN